MGVALLYYESYSLYYFDKTTKKFQKNEKTFKNPLTFKNQSVIIP